jgi:hypothetical protein
MTVVVYTEDCGHYDERWPWVVQVGVDEKIHHCRNTSDSLGAFPSFRLAARWAKTHPFDIYPLATTAIWVDACVEITSPTFVAEALVQMDQKLLGYLPHPDRSTTEEELQAADRWPAKYDAYEHREMVRFLGMTCLKTRGLWAMTVQVASPAARPLLENIWQITDDWSDESHTVLDQLILPFAARASDIATLTPPLGTETGTLWANDWFVRHKHRKA